MNSKQQRMILKITLSGIIMLLGMSLPFQDFFYNQILFIIAYMIIGYDIIIKSCKNILRGKVFDENFLMTIATIGAILIKEYNEAVAVMLFYQIGELFQSYAVRESRKSITNLMNIRPDYANVYRKNKWLKVNPNEVDLNETILVKPGEKIPLDGIIIKGSSKLNTMALTGESLPQSVSKNDTVLNGCINLEGILEIKVTTEFSESTVMKILELVENATNRKSKSENFISKFARLYTPIVVILAISLAFIPPLLFSGATFSSWLYRALSFLVVYCPCALVISIPLSFFGGLGAASKMGILIKGSNYLEALSKTEIVVCDKTGTLTEGEFKVQEIQEVNMKKDELLKNVAYAEYFSNHPIAFSLKKAYGKEIEEDKIKDFKELSGKGISAIVSNHNVLIGNEKLMQEFSIEIEKKKTTNTQIFVAIDHVFSGSIIIGDTIKQSVLDFTENLKHQGIKKTVILTGDEENISKKISSLLKFDEYHAKLLPQDKVAWIENLITQKSSNGKVLFLGDGVNDAPVLARSDIGCAMGGLGSDAAIESSDIVIMNDDPSKLIDAIKLSKKTMKIVKENIIFAISVKIIVLILSALGLASMWWAVFADVGVSVISIINALRILKGVKKK
ncbi:MAG: cadmium-translocating P-type ATPase [Bacilli bacterium]|nr:cadmium-translocating P-type ATPase [Bacilli bacterium]